MVVPNTGPNMSLVRSDDDDDDVELFKSISDSDDGNIRREVMLIPVMIFASVVVVSFSPLLFPQVIPFHAHSCVLGGMY